MFDMDVLDLLKQGGATVEGLKGTVASNGLIVIKLNKQNGSGPFRVEPYDLLIRKTSVGDETYQVIDPVFYEQGGAHYQCKVKKLGVPEAAAAVQHITYNVSGNNARVNNNSTDNSINVVNIDSQVEQQINALREAVQSEGLSTEQMREALEIVDAVKEHIEAGKPKFSVVKAMLGALPAIGGIAKAATALLAFLG